MKKLILVLLVFVCFSFAPADGTKKCDFTFGSIYERNDGSFYMLFNSGQTADISESIANFHCNKE